MFHWLHTFSCAHTALVCARAGSSRVRMYYVRWIISKLGGNILQITSCICCSMCLFTQRLHAFEDTNLMHKCTFAHRSMNSISRYFLRITTRRIVYLIFTCPARVCRSEQIVLRFIYIPGGNMSQVTCFYFMKSILPSSRWVTTLVIIKANPRTFKEAM
jgi:hypothetical protein